MTADLLNTADTLILGDGTRAVEAYLGDIRVWPVGPAMPPAGVGGSSSASDRVTLTWGVVPGAYQYVVFRNGVEVGRVAAPTTRYTSAGLAPATSYVFQVAAVTMLGQGNLSGPVTVTTATPDSPTLTLTPSTTSVEVYFTTVTFTLATSNAALSGTYTLQRQLPDQAWANVGTIVPGTPLAVAHAIPAHQFQPSISGQSAAFRVHFVGTGLDVYSGEVDVAFHYRSLGRLELEDVATKCTQPFFYQTVPCTKASRPEIKIPAAIAAVASTVVARWAGTKVTYEKYGADSLLGWQLGDVAAQNSTAGTMSFVAKGSGWFWSSNAATKWQDISAYGPSWGVCGKPSVGNAQVSGTGVIHTKDLVITVTCQDGQVLTNSTSMFAVG